MGVDYGSSWGFGVEVKISVEDTGHYLDNLTEGTNFSWFISGNMYEHDDPTYYITSDNADMALDKQQYNLEYYAQELLDFLASRPELKVIGHPNIVGGLLIS